MKVKTIWMETYQIHNLSARRGTYGTSQGRSITSARRSDGKSRGGKAMPSSYQLVLGDGRGNKTHGHNPLWEKPSHMRSIVRDLAEILIHSPHSVLM